MPQTENTNSSSNQSTTQSAQNTTPEAAKPPLLERAGNTVKEFASKINPVERIKNSLGLNKSNEDAEKQALAEKLKGAAAEQNWQLPTGGETYQMAMAGKRAIALGKQLREEIKQLDKDKQNPSNNGKSAGAHLQIEEKQTTQRMEQLAGQFEDLGAALSTQNPQAREEALRTYTEEHHVTNLAEHQLELVEEFREVTEESYIAASDDTEQPVASAFEDAAKKVLENQTNIKESLEKANDDDSATQEQENSNVSASEGSPKAPTS